MIWLSGCKTLAEQGKIILFYVFENVLKQKYLTIILRFCTNFDKEQIFLYQQKSVDIFTFLR